MAEKKSTTERVVAMMGDLKDPAKSGENTHHGYSYLTADDLYRAVRPLMVQHGLRLRSRVDSCEHAVEQKVFSLMIDFAFVSEADEDPAWDRMAVAHAYKNPSDAAKAFGAAMTYAQRYWLSRTLLIATPEDDEIDAATPPEQEKPKRAARKPAPKQAPPPAKDEPRKPAAVKDAAGGRAKFIEECKRHGVTMDDAKVIIAKTLGKPKPETVADWKKVIEKVDPVPF